MSNQSRKPRELDIAIIGIGCRFPGADSPDAFWRNLRDGVESIAIRGDSSVKGSGRVEAGAVLSGIDRFDASFFGYTRREAEALDPQQRFFLECSWEALEDAGYDSKKCRGPVGVYGGKGISSYLINNVHPARDFRPDRTYMDSASDLALLIANDKDFFTSHVSYKLDLRGPSVNVQAACATSLYAVHFACQGLLSGECELALAGAACIPVPQIQSYVHEPGMPFSPDGHCRPFDALAQGTVFGSGVGVVVLKRLDRALADQDSIYAVIKGTAVNNDGSDKVGMMAPSLGAQANVVAEALRVAEVDSETVSYIEAHGTATALGDPIEIAALTKAFRSGRVGYCAVGSVKGNIGHLGWASGMAGLIKTALSLQHEEIPRTLHFNSPNPEINFSESPFYVASNPIPWPRADVPRRAGVSAFGLGGSNAHVVLEEAPSPAPSEERSGDDPPWRAIAISAKSPEALRDLAVRFETHMRSNPELDLADVAHTANLGRRHHNHRLVVVARTPREVGEKLKAEMSSGTASASIERDDSSPPLKAALFPGQGSERIGMGRQLYETEPVFRSTLDSLDGVFREALGATAGELLYGTGRDGAPIDRISVAQPLMFAVQMALVSQWRSWGVEPDIVMGHSLGEYAAACTAGLFGIEEGLRLVAERGRLLERLPDDGEMAAVYADEHYVRRMIRDSSVSVSVAAVNGSENTVIAGRSAEVRALCSRFDAAGVKSKVLGIHRAGHSPLMDPILDELEKAARAIDFRAPRIDVISNLTGERATRDIRTPEYWRRHLREPVLFAAGIQTLKKSGAVAFIEMGPAPVLSGMASAILPGHPGLWLPSLRPGREDRAQMLDSLGQLYARGFPVQWESLDQGRRGRRRLHLPVYPFQRRRFWVDPPEAGPESPSKPKGEFAGTDEDAPQPPSWRNALYEVSWGKKAATLGSQEEAAGATSDRNWLIAADRGGVGDRLAAELRSRGHSCVIVRVGEDYSRLQNGEYAVRAGDSQHLERLISDVAAPIRGVVHLWSLDAPELPAEEPELLADPLCAVEAARTGCGSALSFVQVSAAISGTPPRIWLVTRGAQPASEGGVNLSQAATLGFGKVAAIEHPELRCVRVDLDIRGDGDVRLLAVELNEDGNEQEVAFRAGARLVPRLVRHSGLVPDTTPVQENACYLVIGGLRGLGLLAAERLAARGARMIVLAGRSAPDAPSARRIEALRRRGTEILVEQVDVSDAPQVRELLRRIQAPGHPLRGVIHCATVLDDGVIGQLDWKRFVNVLLPKAQGAWNLHVLLRDGGAGLDFFVLFSSATSLVGNSGQANYAAGNAFLDALARHRRALGLPGLAINWGPWSDAGFLADQPDAVARLERGGMLGLSGEEGGGALDRLISSTEGQIAVLPFNWPVFLRNNNLSEAGFFAGMPRASSVESTVSVSRRVADASGHERLEIVRDHVYAQAARILGAETSGSEAMSSDKKLVEYGMDSLSAIQLRNLLQSSLECSLPPTVCFQNPTVSALAKFLDATVLDAAWIVRILESPADAARVRAVPSARVPGAVAGPLSSQQHRWLSLIRAGYGQRVVPIVFHARLDPTAFRSALVQVVERHEILRSRFPGDKIRVMDAEEALPPHSELFDDLSGLEAPARASAIGEHVESCGRMMPDPALRPSWAIKCLNLSGDRFVVLLSLQHLEFDGTSLSVFVDEIRESYRAILAGGRADLRHSSPYREYVDWQREYLSRELFQDRAFFEGLYSSLQNVATLPGHAGFARTVPFESSRHTPRQVGGRWSDVQAAASVLNVSPFSVLLAAYSAMLAEATGAPEVVVGVITNARSDPRFARTIGPFTAPFPVRIGASGFRLPQLVLQCHRLVSAVNARSSYPVADLVGAIPAFRGLPPDTYFTDFSINFTNYPREKEGREPKVEVLEILGPISAPEFLGANPKTLRRIPGLHLVIDLSQGELRFNFWYHAHRFTETQAIAWAARFSEILDQTTKEMSATAAPHAGVVDPERS